MSRVFNAKTGRGYSAIGLIQPKTGANVGSVMRAYEPKLTISPLKDVNGHSSHFNLDGIAVQAVLIKISAL